MSEKDALAAASRGWGVVPLHSIRDGKCSCGKGEACDSPGKHPRTPHGIKDATTDEEAIQAWWTIYLDANVGIATGGGLVVLDFDHPRAREAFEEEYGPLPETFEVKTGKGFHLYFRVRPGTVIKNKTKLGGLPVDVRSDGGYVVGAGSTHISGAVYTVVNDIEPAMLPEKVLAALTEGGKKEKDSSPPAAEAKTDTPGRYPDSALRGYDEGKRNDGIFAFCCWMVEQGYTEVEVEALAGVSNQRSRPPLAEAEVTKIIRSAEGKLRKEQSEPGKLEVITFTELKSRTLPPRKLILEPWLREKDLAMIYGFRGVGKTWVSMGLAVTVAAGGTMFDTWKAPEPVPTLFIDGELPFEDLKDRAMTVAQYLGVDPGDNLRILTPDLQEFGLPDLATKEGQDQIEPYIGNARFIVLDNLSTLMRDGAENEAESWQPVQDWLLSLRRRGITVVFMHHSGLSGRARGTTKREDVLSIIIKLNRPDDADELGHGGRFEVLWQKTRGLAGGVVEPFEVRIENGPPPEERMGFQVYDLDKVKYRRVVDLYRDGVKPADIVAATGTSRGYVYKAIKSYKDELEKSGKKKTKWGAE